MTYTFHSVVSRQEGNQTEADSVAISHTRDTHPHAIHHAISWAIRNRMSMEFILIVGYEHSNSFPHRRQWCRQPMHSW